MNAIINFVKQGRAIISRAVKPRKLYLLFSQDPRKRAIYPISTKYGFDRGTPIDRYYIEKFLTENQDSIKGRTLEIHDSYYTKKFGKGRVTQADALDFDQGNKEATVYGDLRNLSGISDNTYDTLIITHTLGVIDDFNAAAKECIRILKPGGILLITVSALSPISTAMNNHSYWRFTPAAVRYLFGKLVGSNNIVVREYGNCLSGQAFWVGLAQEDLKHEELEFHDPGYAFVIGARVTK